MRSYSYEKVTADVRHHIEQIAGTVRAQIAQGEQESAQNLAASLWGAFRLWERITWNDQQDGDAWELESAIEKLEEEVRKASSA